MSPMCCRIEIKSKTRAASAAQTLRDQLPPGYPEKRTSYDEHVMRTKKEVEDVRKFHNECAVKHVMETPRRLGQR